MLVAAAALFTASVARQSQAPATDIPGPASQDRAKTSTKTSPSARGRKIPCQTPENASLCYWTHGRLSVYEGNPTLRIWKLGTHRILGVYNGPSHFPPRISSFDDDVFNPELPANLGDAYLGDRRRWEKQGNTGYGPPDIFADFEICPLEPEKKGEMQAVCIESARNVFVENRWR
jgi:hypothetical protein